MPQDVRFHPMRPQTFSTSWPNDDKPSILSHLRPYNSHLCFHLNQQQQQIFFNKFIYLFLAALGLRCCTRAFSSCGEWGLLFVAVRGLLVAVASRCGARALGMQASVIVARGLSSCGLQALEHRLSSCGTQA